MSETVEISVAVQLGEAEALLQFLRVRSAGWSQHAANSQAQIAALQQQVAALKQQMDAADIAAKAEIVELQDQLRRQAARPPAKQKKEAVADGK